MLKINKTFFESENYIEIYNRVFFFCLEYSSLVCVAGKSRYYGFKCVALEEQIQMDGGFAFWTVTVVCLIE